MTASGVTWAAAATTAATIAGGAAIHMAGGPEAALAIGLLAVSLSCIAYWVAVRVVPLLPLPPLPDRQPAAPVRRPPPLEQAIAGELAQAGLPISPRALIWATVTLGLVGGLAAWPFRSGLLIAISGATFGALPYQLVRTRIRLRQAAIRAAVGPALVQIGQIATIRRHPLLAISEAVPMLQPPLRDEFQRALAETQAGLPLEKALRSLAVRCGGDFYLHQMAELVAINIISGGDLAGGLQRLAARLRTLEELRAEESAELFGYKWLTRILFGAALLPLPYWAMTGSPHLQVFATEPVARVLLIWVVLSGLVIASLPYWLAIDES